jgi:acyl-CoA thioester hydrolase
MAATMRGADHADATCRDPAAACGAHGLQPVQLSAVGPPAGAAATPPHRFGLRVYYEDTDLAGIVYYANYLRFIERARTEWVRALGIDQTQLRDEAGLVFAVRRIEAEYHAPARFDDTLTVETRLHATTGARLTLDQTVLRGGERLFEARVMLVAMGLDGRARRLPPALAARLPAG